MSTTPQYPIPLRNVSLDANPARLFSANQDVIFKHKVGDIFKTDGRFIKLEIVSRRDALQEYRL